jgi:hypothetical protein
MRATRLLSATSSGVGMNVKRVGYSLSASGYPRIHIKACVEQCDHFRKHSKYYQRKHLYCRLETTNEKEDKKAESQILAIIQQEKDRSFWRCLNYAPNKPRGSACFKLQVEQVKGIVDEINGKEDLHETIWDNIHYKHFTLLRKP